MTPLAALSQVDNSWPINLPPSAVAEEIHCDLALDPQDVQQLIETHYTVFATNVDILEDAEVICFGETHTIEDHRKHSAMIIDELSQPNDVLLLEEPAPNQPEQYSKYLKKQIETQCWDAPVSEKDKEELLAYSLAEEFVQRPSCPTCIEVPENTKIPSCCLITCALSAVLCDCICSKIFSSCIRKYYKRKYLQGFQKIIKDCPLRNEFMRKNIERVVSQGKRAFLNSGSAHLRPIDPKRRVKGIDYTAVDQAVEDTLNYLRTKKFIVLIPKE